MSQHLRVPLGTYEYLQTTLHLPKLLHARERDVIHHMYEVGMFLVNRGHLQLGPRRSVGAVAGADDPRTVA